MDKDIKQGLDTFYETESALRSIIANWDLFWSYGCSSHPVLDDMLNTSHEFAKKAREMLLKLETKKEEWKTKKTD